MKKLRNITLIAIGFCCFALLAGIVMPFYVQAFGFEKDEILISKTLLETQEDSRINITLNDKGNQRNFLIAPTTCGEFLENIGLVLTTDDIVSISKNTLLSDEMEITVERTTFEIESKLEEIPYGTTEVGIDTIPKGTRELVSAGVVGNVQRTYLVKYVNGVAVDQALYTEVPVCDPINEVVNVGIGGTVVAKDGTVYEYNYRKQMEATAYTYVPGKTTMTTATGERLRKGIVAVDPKVIPMHTKMFITGSVEYGLGVAEDTGGVIKGNIVDLAYMSYDECIQFGRRQMQVYILD